MSLVPSITEALAWTRPEAVVGATEFCTHPEGLDVERVRGTKNPDTAAIAALAPDLVVANKEENREIDVRRLRSRGVPVWVTRIEGVRDAFDSLGRMFVEALGWQVPDWLTRARHEWSGPPLAPRATVAVPIWRDPWMVVGPRTFTSDLLRQLGLQNVFDTGADRYPTVELARIDTPMVDVVLLPDEPYAFSREDGPEAFTVAPTALVSGRMLTWYGPSLLDARHDIDAAVDRALAATS